MRRGVLVFVVAWLALAALPFVRDSIGFPVFYLVFLSAIWFWTAEATSWNLLSGYSGYFSFGQAALVGVGAYATAVLVGRHDWPFAATLPVAGALSMVLALGIGAVAFRLRSLRGEIFALLTLAVPFILASIARITPAIDGGQGIIVPTPDVPELIGGFQEALYLVSLTIAMLALAIAWTVTRLRVGWALFAIRDAEDVAEGLGIPTFRAKMIAIGLSGLLGGLGGSVYALQIGFVTVESVFGLTIPLFVIVMAVLGGRSSWAGPLIGAIIVVTLQDRLAASGFEGWSLVILGSVLAILIILAPEGLAARVVRRPLATGLALVVPPIVLAILEVGGGFVDWLAAGLIAASVVALAPLPDRVARSLRARRGGPAEPATSAAQAPADPSADKLLPNATDAIVAAVDAGEPATATDRPVVEVVEVARHYGGVRALDGISLEVRAGEILGVVGPNGSGKSTLIGLVAGAIRPTAGTIRIAGESIAGLPAHRVAHLGVARTYQIPRPFESMTVRDNVALAVQFGRTPAGLDEARARADAALATVGLDRRADARPSEINLHQRQLLEMARAIAARPRVLLLDEALAGLNPAEIDEAVAVVRRINEAGVTIVVVEHLLRVVNQLADRLVVLDQGRLLAAGAPATVMADPAVVRAYLGSAAGA